MAKKLFAMAIMMIAAISFTSCEKDDIVGINGNIDANVNGGDKPDPEVEYVLRNIHKNNTVDNSTEYPEIIDNHNAQLVNRQTEEVVAEEGYDNVFKAEYDRTVYVPYGELNSLVGKRFEIDADGIAHIGSTSVKFTLVRQGETPSVYFDENGKTYSYPEDLECCKYTFLNVQTAKQFAADNILPAEIVVLAEHYENGDTEELTLLGEFTAVEGDHFDREFDEYVTVTGNGTATLKEYETQNGERTGKETLLKGTFEYTFNAGAEIVKTSANQPSLQGNVLNVNANSTSFSYTLDGAVFNDNWTTIVPTEVEFTATDGTKIRRPFKSGWTLTSLSFTNVNNVWSNNAQLAADGIAQDDDTQIIRLNAVIDWEPADNATVTGKNETSLVVYETENGIRTGKTEIVKADYTASLAAGALIEKTSKGAISLSNTNGVLAGSSVQFTYTLDGESFHDAWVWNAQSTATFTLPNNKQVTKLIKAEYTARSTKFSSSNGMYSNAASLYADNIAVASDEQVLKVNAPAEPTYPGYKAYNTKQWAVSRIYDRNANRNLVIWTMTLENLNTGAIVGAYQVLEGNAAANELPQQLQSLSAPSFETPYSMFFNVKTSAWEYGSLRFAEKGKLNETWDYVNWNVTNNQPMSVNISQDVADDVVWLEDNMVIDGNTITITYNGKKYTIVSE